MPDWANDRVLGALAAQSDLVADLVRAFPGRADAASDAHWVGDWLTAQAVKIFEGAEPPDVRVVATDSDGADLSCLSRPPVTSKVRLVACEPRYFRGYRELTGAANLDADLLVIEGPNSTGKTGLSEAIEWALTGALSRRESGAYGHPRELEGCIANEFRPDGEATWVRLILDVDGRTTVLRRLLVEDYTATQKGRPISELYLDDALQSEAHERELVERFFAGVHPLLMQHTLRQFVHDTPENRRLYFERLLQIDELTALIEKAVVGDAALRHIRGPTRTDVLSSWAALEEVLAGALSPGIMASTEGAERADLPNTIRLALQQVAAAEFGGHGETEAFTELVARLDALQTQQREVTVPVLGKLRPSKTLPKGRAELATLLPAADGLVGAWTALGHARRAGADVGEAQRAVSAAYERLVSAGLLIADSDQDQLCPLCEHVDPPTLTTARIARIAGWTPLADALSGAEAAWERLLGESRSRVAALRVMIEGAIPAPPSSAEAEKGLPERLLAPLTAVLDSSSSARRAAATGALDRVEAALQDAGAPAVDALESQCQEALNSLAEFSADAAAYREVFDALDQAVAGVARQDDRYMLRDRWLAVARAVPALAEEIMWLRARKAAQGVLEAVRSGLIELRARLIEDARDRFSSEMTTVWGLLRQDVASAFTRLDIPEARGRGYKLEFEVRASVGDGKASHDVSALKVFSESQINVVGIAAYVTRARLLGHTVLVFDDPVQSMDEDHHNSFASRFLTSLLDEGFQVVLLTHSESFARDIAAGQRARDGYATLRTRLSLRQGSLIDEGSRRVSERLKVARELMKEGHVDDPWRFVRFAVERLYTLVKLNADPSFDHRSWKDQDAKYMWANGVSEVVLAVDPAAGAELKRILTFAAGGVHDKQARGPTDLTNAIKYLNGMLDKLRLGAG